MSKHVQVRLGQVFLVLALVLGTIAFSGYSAEASWESCSVYGSSCDWCYCMRQSCMRGEVSTHCSGDYYCCWAEYPNDCINGCGWH